MDKIQLMLYDKLLLRIDQLRFCSHRTKNQKLQNHLASLSFYVFFFFNFIFRLFRSTSHEKKPLFFSFFIEIQHPTEQQSHSIKDQSSKTVFLSRLHDYPLVIFYLKKFFTILAFKFLIWTLLIFNVYFSTVFIIS